MIASFDGEYRFLSNFWQEPGLADRLWGYRSTEHYFQAMKTLDQEERAAIKAVLLPGQAKRLGRKVTLRKDWEDIKDNVMLVGLERKFAPGTTLANKLLATGEEYLVEGNRWHDNYWGDCNCPDCAHFEGTNVLGLLLMEVRKALRQS